MRRQYATLLLCTLGLVGCSDSPGSGADGTDSQGPSSTGTAGETDTSQLGWPPTGSLLLPVEPAVAAQISNATWI